MKKVFSPVLAAAVVATLPATALAIDGWDYSGAEARANAQQLDYFSLRDDMGNIWVNPALLAGQGSQVRLTIDNRNRQGIYRVDDNLNPGGVDSSGGAGGVFFRLTPSSTVGAYIGRRSTSDFRTALSFDEYGAPSMTGGTGSFDNDLRPENQFDLFYALSLAGFDAGVRLNYQANERRQAPVVSYGFDGDAGIFTGITSAQYIEQLRQQAAAQPGDVEVNLAQEMGVYGDIENRTQAVKREATELNLTVGFNFPALGLDGAFQWGNASGTQRVESSESFDEQQWARLTDSEEDVLLDRGGWFDQARDQVSVDEGQTLGLALRYQVFEREADALMVSFSYRDTDYSGVLSGERHRRAEAIAWEENAESTAFVQDERVVTELAERWAGRVNDERQTFALNAAYRIEPVIGTRVTVTTGLVRGDMSFGQWLSREEDRVELQVQDEMDGDVVSETLYNNVYGMIDRMDFDITTTDIPLVVALEQDLSERWTLRGSISRNLYSRSKSDTATYLFNAVDLAERRAPEADDLDQSPQVGPDRYAQTGVLSGGNESRWDNQETTVRIGVGYRRNNISVDGVFSASLDRLFTSDHKILEDSKFARVTVGYHF